MYIDNYIQNQLSNGIENQDWQDTREYIAKIKHQRSLAGTNLVVRDLACINHLNLMNNTSNNTCLV